MPIIIAKILYFNYCAGLFEQRIIYSFYIKKRKEKKCLTKNKHKKQKITV